MDAYAQYARWRLSGRFGMARVGLGNRRLAAMLGDFVYETSSAEDESRRILEWLYKPGKETLTRERDLAELERFTSEHNRAERRALGEREPYVPWSRMDYLSQKIVYALSDAVGRDDPEFVENLAALDRMFSTTKALREFRNKVDHYAPSDDHGRLHFYRDTDTSVSVRAIWGWTEVAASYWSNLTPISGALSLATGISIPTLPEPRFLQWPPAGMSIHGLRVLEQAAIPVSQQQLRDALKEWLTLTRRWN